jgi:hypothetical protein
MFSGKTLGKKIFPTQLTIISQRKFFVLPFLKLSPAEINPVFLRLTANHNAFNEKHLVVSSDQFLFPSFTKFLLAILFRMPPG